MNKNKRIKHAACYDSAAFAKQNKLIINFVGQHGILFEEVSSDWLQIINFLQS